MKKEHKKWLTDNFGDLVTFDEPMSKHTTFKIGGPANLVTVKTDQQLQTLARWARENHQPLMILGAGSNVLVRDDGIEGLVLRLTNGFGSIHSDTADGSSELVKVTAGAGNLVRELGRYALNAGLVGLNFTLGIPGTVGGALCMNAGAWGSCMADTVWSVSLLDSRGHIVEKKKKDL